MSWMIGAAMFVTGLTPLASLLALLAFCRFVVRREGTSGLRNVATVVRAFRELPMLGLAKRASDAGPADRSTGRLNQ